MDYDVVVVGAGFAGLTAATRAAELGLRVAVLERGEGPDYWCNSRVSTGVYHIASMPETAGEEALFERVMRRTGNEARPGPARTIAADSPRVKDWLVAQGAVFEPYYRQPSELTMLAPARKMHAGLDWRGNGSDHLLRLLGGRFGVLGGRISPATAAKRLVMENGACAGVIAEEGGAEVEFLAGAVVLADGGFQASPDLVAKYIMPKPDRLRQRNTETGVGDGLRMAEEAGAALVGLDKFYGHILSRDAMENEGLWPYPQLDVISATGILVDGSGRRFADEGLGGIYLANAIAALDDPLSAVAVFDRTVWDEARHADVVPPNPALEEAGGTVLHADDLGSLARLAGLPEEALQSTVAGFNKAVSSGGAANLAPARTADVFPARPIEQPPFHAIPVCAGITVTMGGVAIDESARVVRPDGAPIPGLFAAGSTVGGVEGGPNAGYVGGLIKAFVFGHRAAETIAAGPHTSTSSA